MSLDYRYLQPLRSTQILTLYDRMTRIEPSPIVRLNRAVALAEMDGPDVALAEIEQLVEALDGYHALHATRADLLRLVGRIVESREAYDRASQLTGNPAERTYLARRREELGDRGAAAKFPPRPRRSTRPVQPSDSVD